MAARAEEKVILKGARPEELEITCSHDWNTFSFDAKGFFH